MIWRTIHLQKNPISKKARELLAVEWPERAILKSIKNSCIRSLRVHRIEENRDNHASFRDICSLSDQTTYIYNSTYDPLDTGTDEAAMPLVEYRW